ncbi:MAG TPA: methyltransferase type 11 [Chloroflexi bacterium]|nr:methyltransferase type 11 [Chloroflexota bacterium]
MDKNDRYIPALGHERLTPLYDPLLRWIIRESRFKTRLVEQAHVEAGQRVLDLGCGTGTLTILVKQAHPEAEVIGLDGDRAVLEIARAKAAKADVAVFWTQGMAFQLPYADNSFDRILSGLVFHHLTTENKRRTFREIFRVLRPGGELHVADFGRPHNAGAYFISLLVGRFEEATANVRGLLPEMFREAGLSRVAETNRFMTVVGTISLYEARRS